MPQPEHKRQHTPWQQRVGEGALDAHGEGMKQLAKRAAKGAPKALGRAMHATHWGPALAYDLASIKNAEDPWREGFGVAGSVIGGAAGTGLGSLAGGVNAPIGAVLGSAAGDDLGKDFYDDHKAAIHKVLVKPATKATRAVGEGIDRWVDENRRRLDQTRKWIDGRNSDLRRR